MKVTTKQIDDYMKKTRILFPYISKAERRYLKKLRQTIIEYVESEAPTFDNVIETFGTPQEIVNEYIMNIDIDILYKRLKFRKTIFFTALIIIIAVVIVSTFKLYYYHDLYVKALDSIPLVEETIIY